MAAVFLFAGEQLLFRYPPTNPFLVDLAQGLHATPTAPPPMHANVPSGSTNAVLQQQQQQQPPPPPPPPKSGLPGRVPSEVVIVDGLDAESGTQTRPSGGVSLQRGLRRITSSASVAASDVVSPVGQGASGAFGATATAGDGRRRRGRVKAAKAAAAAAAAGGGRSVATGENTSTSGTYRGSGGTGGGGGGGASAAQLRSAALLPRGVSSSSVVVAASVHRGTTCVGIPTHVLLHLLRASISACTTISIANGTFLTYPIVFLRGGAASRHTSATRRHVSEDHRTHSPLLSGGRTTAEYSDSLSSHLGFDDAEGDEEEDGLGGTTASELWRSELHESTSTAAGAASPSGSRASPTSSPPSRVQRHRRRRNATSERSSAASHALLVLAMPQPDTNDASITKFVQCFTNAVFREELRCRYLSHQVAEMEALRAEYEQCGGAVAGAAPGPSPTTTATTTTATATTHTHAGSGGGGGGGGAAHQRRRSTSPDSRVCSPTPTAAAELWGESSAVATPSAAIDDDIFSYGYLHLHHQPEELEEEGGAGEVEADGGPRRGDVAGEMMMMMPGNRKASPPRSPHLRASGGSFGTLAAHHESPATHSPSVAATTGAGGDGGAGDVFDFLLQRRVSLCVEMMQLARCVAARCLLRSSGRSSQMPHYRLREAAMAGHRLPLQEGGYPMQNTQQQQQQVASTKSSSMFGEDDGSPAPDGIYINQLLFLPHKHLTGGSTRSRRPLAALYTQLNPCSLIVLEDANFKDHLVREYAEVMGKRYARLLPLSMVFACLFSLAAPWRIGAFYRSLERALLDVLQRRQVALQGGSTTTRSTTTTNNTSLGRDLSASVQFTNSTRHRELYSGTSTQPFSSSAVDDLSAAADREAQVMAGLQQAASLDFVVVEIIEFLRLQGAITVDSEMAIVFTHGTVVAPLVLDAQQSRLAARHGRKGQRRDSQSQHHHHHQRRSSQPHDRTLPSTIILHMLMRMYKVEGMPVRNTRSDSSRDAPLFGQAGATTTTTTNATLTSPVQASAATRQHGYPVFCVWGSACPYCEELAVETNEWVVANNAGEVAPLPLRWLFLDPCVLACARHATQWRSAGGIDGGDVVAAQRVGGAAAANVVRPWFARPSVYLQPVATHAGSSHAMYQRLLSEWVQTHPHHNNAAIPNNGAHSPPASPWGHTNTPTPTTTTAAEGRSSPTRQPHVGAAAVAEEAGALLHAECVNAEAARWLKLQSGRITSRLAFTRNRRHELTEMLLHKEHNATTQHAPTSETTAAAAAQSCGGVDGAAVGGGAAASSSSASIAIERRSTAAGVASALDYPMSSSARSSLRVSALTYRSRNSRERSPQNTATAPPGTNSYHTELDDAESVGEGAMLVAVKGNDDDVDARLPQNPEASSSPEVRSSSPLPAGRRYAKRVVPDRSSIRPSSLLTIPERGGVGVGVGSSAAVQTAWGSTSDEHRSGVATTANMSYDTYLYNRPPGAMMHSHNAPPSLLRPEDRYVPEEVLLQFCLHHLVAFSWGTTGINMEALLRLLERHLRRLRPFLANMASIRQLRLMGHTSETLATLVCAQQQPSPVAGAKGGAAAAGRFGEVEVRPAVQDGLLSFEATRVDVQLMQTWELYERLSLLDCLSPCTGMPVRPAPTRFLLHAVVNEFSDVLLLRGLGVGLGRQEEVATAL